MNEGLLKAELNNLAAFFNDETAYIHVPDEIYNSSKEDTWTTFLNAYLSNDQKNMAFCIGRLSQLDWPDKEKYYGRYYYLPGAREVTQRYTG